MSDEEEAPGEDVPEPPEGYHVMPQPDEADDVVQSEESK